MGVYHFVLLKTQKKKKKPQHYQNVTGELCVVEGAWRQALQPEFNLQSPHSVKREMTLAICPLISHAQHGKYTQHTCIPTHITYTE